MSDRLKQTLRLGCRLRRHFAVIPAELAGKESCEQSWDAPGMQDLSVPSLPDRCRASRCLRVRQMQNKRLSSAGTAALHGRSGSGPPRVLLGWGSREPVPSYPTLTGHQSSEGGEKPSALSSRGENLLDCLLLGGWKSEQLPRAGAFHICHPRGGCVSGEALCPLAAPRAKAAAPLRAPEWRPCAVRRRCPASRHPPASPHRAPSEPGACQGRRGLEGRQLRPRGRSQPGGCWSPQTRSGGTRVGRRGHGDTGTAAFPGPAGSPAPLLCPSRASAMNSLSRLNRPGGEGGRYRAKETYILCSHR